MRTTALALIALLVAFLLSGCGTSAANTASNLQGAPAPAVGTSLTIEQVRALSPTDSAQLSDAFHRLNCTNTAGVTTLSGADWASLDTFSANEEALSCRFTSEVLQLLLARALKAQSTGEPITTSFSRQVWKNQPNTFTDATIQVQAVQCQVVTGKDYADCVNDGYQGVPLNGIDGPKVLFLPTVPHHPFDKHLFLAAPGQPALSGMEAYNTVRQLSRDALASGSTSIRTVKWFMQTHY